MANPFRRFKRAVMRPYRLLANDYSYSCTLRCHGPPGGSRDAHDRSPVIRLPSAAADLLIDRERELANLTTDVVWLFIDRARAVTPSDASTIAVICRQLEGLPPAIELAAARISVFTAAALLDQLRDSTFLDTLTSRVRDLPARQPTIRDTIQWSYNVLDPAQQQRFIRFVVFAGGWTMPPFVTLSIRCRLMRQCCCFHQMISSGTIQSIQAIVPHSAS